MPWIFTDSRHDAPLVMPERGRAADRITALADLLDAEIGECQFFEEFNPRIYAEREPYLRVLLAVRKTLEQRCRHGHTAEVSPPQIP